MNERTSGLGSGIKFGLLSAVVYIVLIIIWYKALGNNPMMLGMAKAVSYVIIIIIFFLAAYTRRKELGGYATVKEIFGTVFIVILFAELSCGIFNYLYLRYIDPEYLQRFAVSTVEWMRQNGQDPERIKEFTEAARSQTETSFGIVLLDIAQKVIVSSIVGLLISFIMKRNNAERSAVI
jgi:hypothetical protein